MSRRGALATATPVPSGHLRRMADQVFSRAAGAPLVGGNHVRVLRDAAENYPAWEAAIASATRTIHLEMYIVHLDRTGRRFIDLLARRARDGVTVRVVYDWFGCGFGPIRGLFTPLIRAGGQVRVFNPPSISAALGWLRRNHRKLVVVDSRIAFISGLCIGQMWEGRPDRKQAPWRDTGVEIVGPAVADAEDAFAESWRLAGGEPIARAEAPQNEARENTLAEAGDVDLRLIATEPFTASLLRLDLLVATMARRSLWITDAYFIGHGPYLEALRRTAIDGVDVRMLLPQGSDVGWTVSVSRTLYRSLLEVGIRIFEWNGTMVHAKTAVADSRWARVGSTNLNLTSWIGNWELDVAIENERIATTLEAHFLEDLEHSTEIRLAPTRSAVVVQGKQRPAALRSRARHSGRRVVRTVKGLGHSLGAAMTGNRPLEEFEYPPLILFGALLSAAAIGVWFEPRVLAWPFVVVAGWAAVTVFVEAVGLWVENRRRR